MIGNASSWALRAYMPGGNSPNTLPEIPGPGIRDAFYCLLLRDISDMNDMNELESRIYKTVSSGSYEGN